MIITPPFLDLDIDAFYQLVCVNSENPSNNIFKTKESKLECNPEFLHSRRRLFQSSFPGEPNIEECLMQLYFHSLSCDNYVRNLLLFTTDVLHIFLPLLTVGQVYPILKVWSNIFSALSALFFYYYYYFSLLKSLSYHLREMNFPVCSLYFF